MRRKTHVWAWAIIDKVSGHLWQFGNSRRDAEKLCGRTRRFYRIVLVKAHEVFWLLDDRSQ